MEFQFFLCKDIFQALGIERLRSWTSSIHYRCLFPPKSVSPAISAISHVPIFAVLGFFYDKRHAFCVACVLYLSKLQAVALLYIDCYFSLKICYLMTSPVRFMFDFIQGNLIQKQVRPLWKCFCSESILLHPPSFSSSCLFFFLSFFLLLLL